MVEQRKMAIAAAPKVAGLARTREVASDPALHQKLRVVFIGCVKEGKECLEEVLQLGCDVRAIITFNDEMARKTSGAVRFDDLAQRYRIPLHRVATTDSPEIVTLIQEIKPDIVFVIGWTRLIHEDILAIPKYGCIGMHASILPRYRGRAPINWALINNEKQTGNSAILLDRGVDTGKLLAQRSFAINMADTCKTLYDKVAVSGREMVREIVGHLTNGGLETIVQDESQATVMPRRTPEDGVINWNLGALELFNWVRALTRPYPGAFSFHHGKKLFIWEARIAHDTNWHADRLEPEPPGTVISTSDGILVSVGEGELLALHRLSFESGGELHWQKMVRLAGLRPGDRLRNLPLPDRAE